MNHTTRTTVVIAIGLLLAACTSRQDDMQTLQGQWDITRYRNAVNELVEPVDGTHPYLTIEDGSVSGSTGCNAFSGGVTVGDDGTFGAGPLASTLIGCDEARSSQEHNIGVALETASMWNIDGETATLSASEGTVMELTRANTDLAETHWFVTGINNGRDAVQSIAQDSEPTLWFEANGRLSGTTGCNDIGATYEQNGSQVVIERVAATKKACLPPELMEQETQMIAALESAHGFTISGERLTITDVEGATLIVARQLPMPTP